VLGQGITPQALEDAIAVAVLFNVIGRCADALDYQLPGDRDFDRAATRLLAQGYAFGKGKAPVHPDHRALAGAVQRRVLDGPGETGAALRRGMAERAAGGPPLEAPYDDLARQIGQAAYKVTDAQVARVSDRREVRGPRSSSSWQPPWAPVCIAGGVVSRRWRRQLKASPE
jgi:hypothetical protein